jgi:TatD DNase family protein
MLDSHCHLDRYEDPVAVAREADARNTFVVAVTNLPSHFAAGLSHTRSLKRVRLALGLHPLAVADHEKELPLFAELISKTSFVGEVGLDFSRAGKATMEQQVRSFRVVARHLACTPKVVSLHSRGAESAVLDILREHGIRGTVFHWYSGPLRTLEEIVEAGHSLSINPAMTVSVKGQEIIRRIPKDRALTETDGPYVQIDGQPARPWDIIRVEEHLATLWGTTPVDARRQVWQNFRQLVGLVQMPLAE